MPPAWYAEGPGVVRWCFYAHVDTLWARVRRVLAGEKKEKVLCMVSSYTVGSGRKPARGGQGLRVGLEARRFGERRPCRAGVHNIVQTGETKKQGPLSTILFLPRPPPPGRQPRPTAPPSLVVQQTTRRRER